MKVEFDNWAHASDESTFVLEMECAPLVGELIHIHKSFFPSLYFEGCYKDKPMEIVGELVIATVAIVEHEISEKGHSLRVCIDV